MKILKKLLSFGAVTTLLLGLWLPGVAGVIIAGGCGGSSGTPAANAGADQTVLIGATVTLDGSGSTGATSYAWELTTAPTGSAAALSDATVAGPTFTADVEGSYVATLTINGDDTLTDTVSITASDSTASYTIPDGSSISTASHHGSTVYIVDSDAEGATLTVSGELAGLTLKGATATGFTWTQVSGPEATIVDGSTATLSFTAPGLEGMMNQSDRFKWQVLPISPDDTEMVFKVAMTDAEGNTGSETVSVFLRDNGEEIHPSSGLSNVPVGARVYLNGPEEQEEEELEITDWTWTLDTKPSGSSAVFADTGTSTSSLQVPSFVPDVSGIYVVSYSTSGLACAEYDLSTINCPGTITISAGNYSGVGTIGGTTPRNPQCATCHGSGSELGDKVTEWEGTGHATMFETASAYYASRAPEPYCWECHTTGFNKDANSLGFDDLVAAAGFEWPSEGMTYDEFLAAEPTVAKLANIQCESCHGPGSEHSGDPSYIAASFAQAGVCGQCHSQEDQWKNSAHNSAHSHEGGFVGAAGNRCSRCHGAKGFVTRLEEDTWLPGEAGLDDDFPYAGVTCVACHDPHDATNSYQLRLSGDVLMITNGNSNEDSTLTVDAGKAAVCYSCHDGNYAMGATSCDSDRNGTSDSICTNIYQSVTQTSPGGPSHYAGTAPLLEGTFAITDLDDDGTDDITLTENSFHSSDSFTLAGVTGDSSLSSTNDKCITCHMYEGPAAGEAGYNEIGGHAFALVADDGTENLASCVACHGSKISEANGGFNRRARADYDGDGSVEGIQDEIKGLLANVGEALVAMDTTNLRCGNTTGTCVGETMPTRIRLVTGKKFWNVGTGDTVAWASKTADQQKANKKLLAAIQNFNMEYSGHSLGIHNAAYEIQVLQGTYEAMTGNAYDDDFPLATIR